MKIRVCCGRSCSAFGPKRIMGEIIKQTGLQPGESSDTIDLDYCVCLDYCSFAPNVALNDTHIITGTSVETVMNDITEGGKPMIGENIIIESSLNKTIENDILGDLV